MPCSPLPFALREGAVAGTGRWMAKSPCTAGSCSCPEGLTYCLPVLADVLRFAPWRGAAADQQPLRHSRAGRGAGRHLNQHMALVVAPLVGFDTQCRRLGMGRSQLRLPPRPAGRPGWSVLRSRCSRSSPAGGVVDARGCDLHRRRHPFPLRCPRERMTARKRYWLMKSGTDAFSIDDLPRSRSNPGTGCALPGAQLHARWHAGGRRHPVLPLQYQGAGHRRPGHGGQHGLSGRHPFDPKSTTTTPRARARTRAGCWWTWPSTASSQQVIALDEIKLHAEELGEGFSRWLPGRATARRCSR